MRGWAGTHLAAYFSLLQSNHHALWCILVISNQVGYIARDARNSGNGSREGKSDTMYTYIVFKRRIYFDFLLFEDIIYVLKTSAKVCVSASVHSHTSKCNLVRNRSEVDTVSTLLFR